MNSVREQNSSIMRE